MRKHIVGGGPDPKTGKTIIVMEDANLASNQLRLECAHSDAEFAYVIQQIERGSLDVIVKLLRGHPRRVIHFVVAPSRFDESVALMEDPAVTPMSDDELGREIIRATRNNN